MHDARATITRAAEWLAVLLLGLMAGFFFAFWVDVAPAMQRLDATAYIATQQHINAVVRNLTFGAVYFGSAAMPWVVTLLHASSAHTRSRAVPWAVVALTYGAAVFWLTRSINVPINDLVAGLDPALAPPSWQSLRDRWNEANAWRTLACGLCFGAGLWLVARRGAPR